MIGGKGWRKGRDIDNVLKPILDFLVHAGLIPDDNHEIVQRITITYSDPPKARDKAFLRVRIHAIGRPANAAQP
jgi:Holliday junction resolvase RusA-like endonuclease